MNAATEPLSPLIMVNSPTRSVLYQQVAARFVTLIEGGTLTKGARLPSVRRLSLQHGVSISTVVQAYRQLENEGWIEARPQSGYYVRLRAPRADSGSAALPEPRTSQPPAEAVPVRVGELVLRVMQASNRADLVQMGVAVPGPGVFPTKQLNRMLASVARQHEEGNTYEFPPGCEDVRTQIARRGLDSGCALSPDDLVLTIGCTEALNLCLRAVAQPGDTILLESPTYTILLQIIESLGLRALEVPSHPREGVSLDALEALLEHPPTGSRIAACAFMPSFSNPVGSCMPDENKRRLVEMLAGRDVPLIEDDVWGDTVWNGPRPRACKAFDTTGNVLLCSSFSKTLAPGYRVGWCAPGKWRKRVEYLKIIGTAANPTLPQLAVAHFLERGGYDHHLRHVRRFYAEQTQFVLGAVGRFFPDGTRVTRPRGGCVLWVELPAGVNTLQLFEDALNRGIAIAPGPMFSSRINANFVRLNCVFHPPEVLEGALKTLGELVDDHAQR